MKQRSRIRIVLESLAGIIVFLCLLPFLCVAMILGTIAICAGLFIAVLVRAEDDLFPAEPAA